MQSLTLRNTTGYIFIILGLLSIAYPFYSSLGIETFFGALFLVGGLFNLFGAFEDKEKSGYVWNFCIGVFYTLAGVYLLSHPFLGLLVLTLLLIALFYTQGILMILFALQQRNHNKNWSWALINGLITTGIATILTVSYPISSMWAFGTLTGINLFLFGLSILMVNRIKKQTKKK